MNEQMKTITHAYTCAHMHAHTAARGTIGLAEDRVRDIFLHTVQSHPGDRGAIWGEWGGGRGKRGVGPMVAGPVRTRMETMHMAPRGQVIQCPLATSPKGQGTWSTRPSPSDRPCPPRPKAPQGCPYVMGKGPVSTSTQLCHLPGIPESKYQQSPGRLAVPIGSGPGLPQEEGQAHPAKISP